MKKKEKAALASPGYLLPESLHQQLTLLRDQLLLTMDFVYAVTQEEEDELLQIRRSMLGRLFESYGLQVDQVLAGLQRAKHH
ncbi:XAC0095 family protein [Dyella mobilis]|uniref:Uncharacterized protein n=1 Tax=Dyella mobilis TaxID=1849582 RepID=A0ABS2KI03_9GAMM|nr:hypothetical protein [Dyella mobilis]MBM7130781.1 hypothetical protein [Dyella mobilis]GLQ97407.1 hypothetical protein GCM10007863_18270 [Dyella mobilis]